MLSYISVDPAQVHHKAGVSTIVAVVSASLSWASSYHELVQTVAGVVAIGSGCMAIAYYYVSILEKLRHRKHPPHHKRRREDH